MNSLNVSDTEKQKSSIIGVNIKEFTTTLKLLLFFILISATITACSSQQLAENIKLNETPSSINLPITENKNNFDKTAKTDEEWKEFKDSKLGISFLYPSNVKIENLPNGVRIFHETKFEHRDPCDNSDDVQTLKNFADFDVTISIKQEKAEVLPACQNAQISKETDSESSDECFVSNNLKGQIISARYQGCGDLTYVFVLPDGKTLEVKRELTGIFGVGADPDEKKDAEAIPGVISREENNRIFYKFISSLKTVK